MILEEIRLHDVLRACSSVFHHFRFINYGSKVDTLFPLSMRSFCVAQVDLKLEVLQPLPSKGNNKCGHRTQPPTLLWASHKTMVVSFFFFFPAVA